MGSAISMQTKTSLLSQGKQFILLIIIFTLIDVAGPIIFNIEQGGSIKHIFSILCFSTFFASIIISIIALFVGTVAIGGFIGFLVALVVSKIKNKK